MFKKLIALDFDGVIHSYTTGWDGPDVIQDPPVEGAMQFLLEMYERYDLCIFSSRNKSWAGRRAMKKWLRAHLADHLVRYIDEDGLVANRRRGDTPVEPPELAYTIVSTIYFPWFKPAAHMYIDDRAWNFSGYFPLADDIEGFKTWQQAPPHTSSGPDDQWTDKEIEDLHELGEPPIQTGMARAPGTGRLNAFMSAMEERCPQDLRDDMKVKPSPPQPGRRNRKKKKRK